MISATKHGPWHCDTEQECLGRFALKFKPHAIPYLSAQPARLWLLLIAVLVLCGNLV